LERNVVVCDLDGLVKWIEFQNGQVYVDYRYFSEWNEDQEQ
jgi:hypothetical protein